MKITIHPNITAGELTAICGKFDLKLVYQPNGEGIMLMPKNALTPTKRSAPAAHGAKILAFRKP